MSYSGVQNEASSASEDGDDIDLELRHLLQDPLSEHEFAEAKSKATASTVNLNIT